MGAAALTLDNAVVINREPVEVYELFSDPVALITALDARDVTCRKLGAAERWVIGHPEKLGDKVVDLSLLSAEPLTNITWVSALRGFEIETVLRFEPHKATSTRLHLASRVQAKSLRAKLMAPLLKLGERRLKRGVRRNLKNVAEKLRAP